MPVLIIKPATPDKGKLKTGEKKGEKRVSGGPNRGACPLVPRLTV